MQPRAIGQLHDLVARDRDLRAQRVVRGIGVWDERVETVVAALELDEDEQLAGSPRSAACARSARQRDRRRLPQSSEGMSRRFIDPATSAGTRGRAVSRRTNASASTSCPGGVGDDAARSAATAPAPTASSQRSESSRLAREPARRVELHVANAAVDARARSARTRAASSPFGRQRRHHRGRCVVHAREALEELLAREQRIAVDPRSPPGQPFTFGGAKRFWPSPRPRRRTASRRRARRRAGAAFRRRAPPGS